jgi:RimJ/RimL family protein N-acetyltransferase
MVGKGKITLRAIEENDLDLIQTWRNNEDLRRYFREYRDFSKTQIKNWYQKMIQSKNFEMFLICNEKEPVGVSGITYIDWINRHGDVHFYIGKKGAWIENKISPIAIDLILSFGFKNLNLNKLWVEIYEIDKKKISFFKEKKFEQDAILRDHYFYKGKYHNSYIYSLLNKDFKE